MEEKLQHPWEYTHMVQFATPKVKIDFSTKEGQQFLARACGKIFAKLPEIIDSLPSGGGWQVSSHNITLTDGSVMISILLQRPKRTLFT